jgi:hypothetical protein
VNKARFAIIGAVVLLAAMAAQASPTGYLLGVGWGNNQLISIDPSTGIFTLLGTINSPDGASNFIGVANGPGGKIYGIDETIGNLYQILPTGGAPVTSVDINAGSIPNFSEGDLTFNGSTGYVVNDAGSGTSAGLYTFNPSAPNSLGGPIGGVNTAPFFDGLAFIGPVLYGLDQDGGNLYIINTSTGVATLVGATGITGMHPFGGLAFDAASGTLYAEVSGTAGLGGTFHTSNLYSLNIVTGNATLIGAIVDSLSNPFDGGLSGIAVETPEPGTIGLMLLGLAGLAFGRRRLLKR